MKRILILYSSIGLGHKTIAENIGWHLARAGYEVKLADILQVQSGLLVSLTSAIHHFINAYTPFVWKWLYSATEQPWTNWTLPLRIKMAKGHHEATLKIIQDFQPDLVITTQVTASAVLAFLKQAGLYKGKWAIAFSDYHLHRYWLYPGADLYLANIPEQRERMVRMGIPEAQIAVLGMTLKPKPQIASSQGRPLSVLIASGSLGLGYSAKNLQELISELHRLNPAIRVIVLCGKNQQAYQKLSQALASQAEVLPYHSPMSELYSIADLFFTKPGGLSVAEALQFHLPILISHWLPGQEEINVKYLSEKGLIMGVVKSVKPREITRQIVEELATRRFQQSLNSNPALPELTQENREGQALVRRVGQMFHSV